MSKTDQSRAPAWRGILLMEGDKIVELVRIQSHELLENTIDIFYRD